MARATIADIAAITGVHKATVSRALNLSTQHLVSASTLRRVQRAAKQLGYIPNLAARSLRTSQSMAVGVMIPDLTNPIFPPIVRGIETFLTPRGYTALVANTDGNDDVERTALEFLVQRNVDGFLLATAHIDHPLLHELSERGVPVVLVNRGTDSPIYPLVSGDDAAGVRAAVEHLISLGHRDLLHLSGPSNLSTTLTRRHAFEAAIHSHPGASGHISEAAALTVEAGVEAMDAILWAGDRRWTAVIAGNDLLAFGVIRAMRARMLACPGDISVIGFNDIQFAQDSDPALTTVRVPFTDMGFEAARLLLTAFTDGRGPATTVTLPTTLVVRDSTGPVRR